VAGSVGGLRRSGNGLLVRVVAIGGLLFAYDTGVISGALLFIKDDLHAGDFAQRADEPVAATAPDPRGS
jgi:hypothetical protein